MAVENQWQPRGLEDTFLGIFRRHKIHLLTLIRLLSGFFVTPAADSMTIAKTEGKSNYNETSRNACMVDR